FTPQRLLLLALNIKLHADDLTLSARLAAPLQGGEADCAKLNTQTTSPYSRGEDAPQRAE
ncbi:MAG: hypothetical protein IKO55_11800, partial [Kiritimatiellae bacterium]|nr:hypothetical protein [Kiritimatiellia bacterium]